MSRSMKVLSLGLVVALVVSGPMIAGPPTHPGYQFGSPTVGGTIDVSVKISSPSVTIKTKPGGSALPLAGDTGRIVAAKAAAALCLAADASPALTCFSGAHDGTFPVALAAPCGFDGGAAGAAALQQIATCVETGDPVLTGDGIEIVLPPTGNFNFYLSLRGTAQFRAGDGLECEMGGGCNGTMSGDLLASHNLRIIPNGVNGVITFNTPGAPGGTGTNPFTVNTTGKTDFQIQQEICDKYSAIGIPTIVHPPPSTGGFIDSSSVAGGYSLESFQGPTVTQFDVTILSGQTAVSQVTGSNSAAPVPALSEWGMIILVALLLLGGIWMMRRRQKLQTT